MATTLGNGMVLMDSFPFDSSPNLVYTDEGYPRGDRSVDAWTMRSTFKQFFTNGVFGTPANALQIAKGDSGLTVTIQPGMCIIEGGMGGVSSKDGPLTLTLDTQAAQGNTPYGIMLRYDDNSDVRGLVFRVVKGTAGSNPVPPEPDQSTANVYELRLGYVVVPNGATDLSSATVHNEKGTSVCPYAAPFVPLDVSSIVADAQAGAVEALRSLLAYFEQYRDAIDAALDDSAVTYLQQQITELQEQIGNTDLSDQVDNATIEYSEVMPEHVEPVLHLKDGAVTPEKLSMPIDQTGGLASADALFSLLEDFSKAMFEFHSSQLDDLDLDTIVGWTFNADSTLISGNWNNSGKYYYADGGAA